jgi:iron complex transport system ATP-binding protein
MLEIDQLNFSYRNKEILRNIDFYIERKDFLGIIGPNGSGKSTLLKNISNILKPENGLIYLDNKIMEEYKSQELARKMAVVPQNTNVNFNFTVYDLIMMGRHPYQDRWGRIEDEDKKIVREAMELTDTKQLGKKKIDQLSGGERQRVIIARALAQSPDLLLLDEPTSSLDINYQGEIFDLLSYLNQELSLTILVVSHDLNLSGQYCDELILLRDGEIYASGSPDNVLTEKNIREVYKTEVIVKENPLTERPYVTLIPKNYQTENLIKDREGKVHVIGGGGSARELLRRLYNQGYMRVSCGVLNQGDRDWKMAKKLDVEVIEIPPFAYIDEESLNKNIVKMEKAEVIIITDTPFGHGNIDNLAAVAKMNNKDIIIEEKRDFSERDYTGGKAKKYWEKILGFTNLYKADSSEQIVSKIATLLHEK